MINDYIFVGVFFFIIFSLFNGVQTLCLVPLCLVQQKPTRYSCPDHYTYVPLNFKLTKKTNEGLKYIFETRNGRMV